MFQSFTLPLEQRDEVKEMIGERAERLAFWNCLMDRSTMDANITRTEPPYVLTNRVTGELMPLDEGEFNDLCRLHLCDWIEQAPRTEIPNYREAAFRAIAKRLGGVALEAYERQFGREAAEA